MEAELQQPFYRTAYAVTAGSNVTAVVLFFVCMSRYRSRAFTVASPLRRHLANIRTPPFVFAGLASMVENVVDDGVLTFLCRAERMPRVTIIRHAVAVRGWRRSRCRHPKDTGEQRE